MAYGLFHPTAAAFSLAQALSDLPTVRWACPPKEVLPAGGGLFPSRAGSPLPCRQAGSGGRGVA
ncbi:MAG: hypothetical protein A2W99_16735 [Bacteroidetes bacterium GWF2_33_16]|nr:MAG: hypothetical protein A2X00_14060 [Bacteroidetes bacterium GWE2_32_14]OFY03394.1 MAG: hypothetical protein A2W99_16735 [Bacteroidetes bacterium GWF2_33_16]